MKPPTARRVATTLFATLGLLVATGAGAGAQAATGAHRPAAQPHVSTAFGIFAFEVLSTTGSVPVQVLNPALGVCYSTAGFSIFSLAIDYNNQTNANVSLYLANPTCSGTPRQVAAPGTSGRAAFNNYMVTLP